MKSRRRQGNRCDFLRLFQSFRDVLTERPDIARVEILGVFAGNDIPGDFPKQPLPAGLRIGKLLERIVGVAFFSEEK